MELKNKDNYGLLTEYNYLLDNIIIIYFISMVDMFGLIFEIDKP